MTVLARISERAQGEPGRRPRRLCAARGVEDHLDGAREPQLKVPESSQSQIQRIHRSIHLRLARSPSLGDGDRVRRHRFVYCPDLKGPDHAEPDEIK
jgi:hypothetical protein